MDNTHSQPTTQYPTLEKLSKSSSVPYVKPDIPEPQASPSIYSLVKGKSFLSQELNVDDTDEVRLVDKFINAKIKSSQLKDDPMVYRGVLKDLTKRLGLTKDHDSNFLSNKLFNYLMMNLDDPTDKMLLFDLLVGEKINARK